MLLGEPEDDLLLRALICPPSLAELSEAQWDALLPRARAGNLLARLAAAGDAAHLTDRLPPKVAGHLLSASTIARHHQATLRWEVSRIERALRPLEVPILLLKGAAYVTARLRPAEGRVVADTDIMVPRSALDQVEATLVDAGWQPIQLQPYDQLYYRTWMHELPPLRHRERGSVIDVHHTILPPSSRLRPDPALLWSAAGRIDGTQLYVLARTDMVLHSAAHLFVDGDLQGSLRDLLDIADLLNDFGRDPGFWPDLLARAEALDLSRPLFYALRFSHQLLRTPVPDEILRDASVHAPPSAGVRMMDWLVPRTLLPGPRGRRSGSGGAALLLYVRSHWLRMPPWLLAGHLAHQSVRRIWDRT